MVVICGTASTIPFQWLVSRDVSTGGYGLFLDIKGAARFR